MKAKVTLILFFILTSIALHAYLTSHYYPLHFGLGSEGSICNVGESFNCDAVAASSYANVFGVPLSVWGLIANGVLLTMVLLFWFGLTDKPADWKRWALYLSGLSSIASVLLAVVSVTQLTTYCLFCIILYFLSFGTTIGLWLIQDTKIGENLLPDLKGLFSEARPLLIALAIIPLASFLTHASIVKKYQANDLNKMVRIIVQDWKSSPQHDFSTPPAFTLGASADDAKMVISEFADFRCGHCKDAAPSLHAFIKSHTDDVHFKFYNFPLDNTCNSDVGQGDGVSCRLAKAVTCANEQARAPQVHDYIFENQVEFQRMAASADVDAALKEVSSKLLISFENLQSCMDTAQTHDRVSAQAKQGQAAGLRGTPTVYVNGRRLDRGHLIPVLGATLNSIKASN